jgi:hypothetical protein
VATGQDEDELPEPPPLRRLRLLVSGLMAVLILGTVTVSAALVIRLGGAGATSGAPGPIAAEELVLPEGHVVVGLGRGAGEVLVITRAPSGAETLRSFDARSGALRTQTPVRRAAEAEVPSGGGDDPAGR